MLGEHSTRQILALAEQNISAEVISRELDLPLEQVKLTLRANKKGTETDRDITDDQLALLRQRVFQLATTSSDESVALKAATFLIERDKPVKVQDTSGVNLTLIQQAIIQAQSGFDALRSKYETPQIPESNTRRVGQSGAVSQESSTGTGESKS